MWVLQFPGAHNITVDVQFSQATSRIGGGRFSQGNVYETRILGPFASKNEPVYSLLTVMHLLRPYLRVTPE